MGLPVQSEVLSLDYVGWTLPKIGTIDASANVNSVSLDIVGWTLPKIGHPHGGTPSSDPTNVIYIKTGASTWSTATAVYVKSGSNTWSLVSDLSIKTGNSDWNT
tara:strand:+ start:114 stop:425 length:312 start_codon:yes stop_codon:yes gene_type:complete